MLGFSDIDYTAPQEAAFTLMDVAEAFGLDLGLDTYPIWDERYREHLNQAIYDHFRFRTIATTTPQMFVALLNRRMCERMPTYNAIYQKVARTQDPFLTAERHSEGTNANASHNDSTSASEAKSDTLSMSSNTPQSYLNDPTDPKYMTALTQTKGDTDTTGTATSDGHGTGEFAQDHTERVGYLGDSMLSALATGFLNTDLMVCDMLEPLFMQVWTDMPR